MSSDAQVKKGDFVYDPFVGTGSILVAAAHRGAQTMGADIDIRVVRDGQQSSTIQMLLMTLPWCNLIAVSLCSRCSELPEACNNSADLPYSQHV